MKMKELIERFEREWDVGGFLGNIREGVFSAGDGEQFLMFLKKIKIGDDAQIPKRLVSLLWYLPSFLEWQKERIQERGSDRLAYDRFVTEVHNTLEIVLGVP